MEIRKQLLTKTLKISKSKSIFIVLKWAFIQRKIISAVSNKLNKKDN